MRRQRRGFKFLESQVFTKSWDALGACQTQPKGTSETFSPPQA
ncbi:unnamed protein product, partial [marine sediment metagenome]